MMRYLWLVLLLMSCAVGAQDDSDFTVEMAELDREFFKRSFNECDNDYLRQHIADDLVFYHDQGGMQDAKTFLRNTQNAICSGSEFKPTRQLIPGSLESFPLYDNGELYGAIQHGEHAFYLSQPDRKPVLTSTAKFTHTWRLSDGKWQLSAAMSYDHQAPYDVEQALLQVLADANMTALGLGVIKAGEVASAQVYGTLDGVTPAPQDSLFKVASLTKPIVTLLTLQLVHAGKLSLDEPLSAYWLDPDIADDERAHLLTPRVVLAHQTGFDNWRRLSATGKLTFNYTPGEGFGYSGEGFEYLRIALENKFDQSLEELAEAYVFAPAGMADTHFWWNPKVDEQRYAKNFDENGELHPKTRYFEANAAANLLTTVADYTAFMQYIFQQQRLMPELYALMAEPSQQLGEQHYFSLGWEILAGLKDGEHAVLHTGKDPGVNTLAIFFPQSKNAYVIFMNGDNSLPVMEHLLPSLYSGSELWNRR
ncbi:class A beta-lactamase-related serine hydrolase [Pseudidiomarina sp. 1APP75-32.1]|uniref:Class A beta-lactamase-related serine hydrolase n=1 Tax=Pseudidiomarina terrestris TaxID=2820060 RepID=A0AAW7QX96_9GAMM|nr:MULTISPECIES: class A beta-lactamase-related serine hydrolase [unclassified Pseudidiomarina]MDN7123450.1 class A beta-lactamase-related serine hydrolase [Pseudidiomarina sp. 1APP75-32.1]MDN7128825.1 class A beta-lactamase-related serine hydrolase [Pseudidiomarina sp. 1APR75-15]